MIQEETVMSVRAETPPTLREKSTWTPRHDKTANIKVRYKST